jgi:branched-chain amino acid transport system permease protein
MSVSDPAIVTLLHDSESEDATTPLRHTVLMGLLFGGIGIYLAAIGLLLMLHERAIIVGVMSLGHATLLAVGLGAGLMAARGTERLGTRLVRGALAGLIAGAMVALLPIVMDAVSLRWMFISLSPQLSDMLTFEQDVPIGSFLMLAAGAVAGLAGAALTLTPKLIRRVLIVACTAVIVAGVFQELIQIMLQTSDTLTTVNDLLYTWEGLTPQGAAIIFVIVVAITVAWSTIARARYRDPDTLTPAERTRSQLIRGGFLLVGLIVLPLVAGAYIGQVMMLVGLYILMGMGLNLEVGLAGLLDLGFVAFFAVGAYVTGKRCRSR